MVWTKKLHEHLKQKRKKMGPSKLMQRLRLRRSLRILPNIFTLGNAFFGFCSIISTAHGKFQVAAYFILLGALMDALDGRIARFAGTTSDLGMQLDSLCDGISFILAPAILMYSWQLHHIEVLGLIASGIFLSAGLLRLARFNITNSEQKVYFIGMPSTLAGCFLAVLVLNSKNNIIPIQLIPALLALVIILGGLMVSSLRFPAFKTIKKSVFGLLAIAIGAGIIALGLVRVLLLLFVLYFLFTAVEIIRFKINKQK